MTKSATTNIPFWLQDFTILFKKNKIFEIWPYKNMSFYEQLNATTRFVILVSLLGYMLLNNYIILLLGVLLIMLIIMMYIFNKKNKESFHQRNSVNDFNHQSSNNPLKNVLLTDYEDNVNKPEVPKDYSLTHEEKINEETKQHILENNKDNKDIHKLFSTLGNNMEFEQSMRQFYINPATTIPNSQSDFLDYCFKDLPCDKPLIIH